MYPFCRCATTYTLKKHVEKKHGEGPDPLKPDLYPCELCSFKAESHLKLQKHRGAKNHNISELPCDQCSDVFTNYSALYSHVKTCHEGEVFKYCDQCPFKTFAINYLRNAINWKICPLIDNVVVAFYTGDIEALFVLVHAVLDLL